MCSENPKFLVYRFEDIFIILVREELLSMYLAFQQGWALSAEKLISEKAQKCEKPILHLFGSASMSVFVITFQLFVAISEGNLSLIVLMCWLFYEKNLLLSRTVAFYYEKNFSFFERKHILSEQNWPIYWPEDTKC